MHLPKSRCKGYIIFSMITHHFWFNNSLNSLFNMVHNSLPTMTIQCIFFKSHINSRQDGFGPLTELYFHPGFMPSTSESRDTLNMLLTCKTLESVSRKKDLWLSESVPVDRCAAHRCAANPPNVSS